jgi:hypothetical protein
MSALETFLKRYLDGENYAPHCFEFYETGYLDGEIFQFQITKSLEQQIQGHVLEVLRLEKELAKEKEKVEKYFAVAKNLECQVKWKEEEIDRIHKQAELNLAIPTNYNITGKGGVIFTDDDGLNCYSTEYVRWVIKNCDGSGFWEQKP